MLVDERMRFEIFPNGHPQFLTKKATQELAEGMRVVANATTLEPVADDDSESAARRIPEPTDRFGSGKNIITLRLRAMEGKNLPDLFEGDFISGMRPSADATSAFLASKNSQQFADRTGYKEFRILEVFWGTKGLVQSLVPRSSSSSRSRSSSYRSTSDTNAYVICEAVI